MPADQTSDTPSTPPPMLPVGRRTTLLRHITRHLLAGVVFILPLVITAAVIYQLLLVLQTWVIDPVARLIIPRNVENEYWVAVETYVTPVISLVVVVVFLYLMGYVFRTRLRCAIDWSMSRIPGVATLYVAVRDVFEALQGPTGLKKIDTVVLVPFPHTDARMAGYLMGRSHDRSGRELACVYIPIALFPPSGYTLVLPLDQVAVTDWPAEETWKLLLSGGLTVPDNLPFDLEETPPQPGGPQA